MKLRVGGELAFDDDVRLGKPLRKVTFGPLNRLLVRPAGFSRPLAQVSIGP
jgi:hypothetical protein